jgi:hypothetical protein
VDRDVCPRAVADRDRSAAGMPHEKEPFDSSPPKKAPLIHCFDGKKTMVGGRNL